MLNAESGTDIVLTAFGGTCTQMQPADLPHGASPDSQDVAFLPGKVTTRPTFARAYPDGMNYTTNNRPYLGCDLNNEFIAGADLGHAL